MIQTPLGHLKQKSGHEKRFLSRSRVLNFLFGRLFWRCNSHCISGSCELNFIWVTRIYIHLKKAVQNRQNLVITSVGNSPKGNITNRRFLSIYIKINLSELLQHCGVNKYLLFVCTFLFLSYHNGMSLQ